MPSNNLHPRVTIYKSYMTMFSYQEYANYVVYHLAYIFSPLLYLQL